MEPVTQAPPFLQPGFTFSFSPCFRGAKKQKKNWGKGTMGVQHDLLQVLSYPRLYRVENPQIRRRSRGECGRPGCKLELRDLSGPRGIYVLRSMSNLSARWSPCRKSQREKKKILVGRQCEDVARIGPDRPPMTQTTRQEVSAALFSHFFTGPTSEQEPGYMALSGLFLQTRFDCHATRLSD